MADWGTTIYSLYDDIYIPLLASKSFSKNLLLH